ncbi:uncharacterized protein LOC107989242 isoform X1 [Cynoglossus semilaevis]|uniref:uncharacterized protein LOC107989242 isoform X1 n=2 Tax=Cynoglossus semilaevis TaxID=244447 RepID=UPI000D62403B|nr:uncharacterized protein LOC107989242 isoform X1 [Cynoglossus semilaevis]
MFLIRCLLFALTLFALVVSQDATAGPRYTLKAGEVCRSGFYQVRKDTCYQCTECHESTGSQTVKECAKYSNSRCQCRPGFVFWRMEDHSVCKCDVGSGLTKGECSECEVGFFNTVINNPCQKWTVCKSGVNITGSRTRDVVCNEPSTQQTKQDVKTTTAVATAAVATSAVATAAVATTAVSPGQEVIRTPRETGGSSHSGHYGKHTGVVLLMLGIFLLVLLTAVVCKQYMSPGPQTKPELEVKESQYGRPVEESGDGSEASVKQNLMEP